MNCFFKLFLGASPAVLLPGAGTGSEFPCAGDKTAGCTLGFVGLFHKDSLVCATEQGSTDGSVRYEGRRRWSVGRVAGSISGHQMVDYVLASTSGQKAA